MITSSEYAVWVMIALLVIVWFLGDPSKQRIVFYACVASFVFALAAASFFIGRRFGLWMLLLAVLTGVSRVYVGVHYPGDILGGFILGSLLSVVLITTRNYTKSIPDFFINIHRRVFQ